MIELIHTQVFQGHHLLVDDLSVTFQPGQFWGIIGRNGVGKSTLLNVMAGMSSECQGKVLIDGESLSTINHRQRAQKISYLFQQQEPCLPFLVDDAISMGRYPWLTTQSEDLELVETVVRQCKIDYLRGRSITQLSGGERKKVEIATCLVQKASHLLLDEPLNHLDVVYQEHIMKMFKAYSQQNTVIMVCHDLQAVQKYCSHVLMLLSNDCYLQGTSATILTAENLERLFDDNSENH
ncbi:MAG: ABC transporter ATP-binding protein [Marinicella sp.]|nr:ABC transporter ATP-binding protein [Xanthomonadales bacterium]